MNRELVEKQIKSGGSPESIFVLAGRVLLVLVVLGLFALGCSDSDVNEPSAGEVIGLTVYDHQYEDVTFTILETGDGWVSFNVRINGSQQVKVRMVEDYFTTHVIENPDWKKRLDPEF